jgi:histidine triad (HIT) family protein
MIQSTAGMPAHRHATPIRPVCRAHRRRQTLEENMTSPADDAAQDDCLFCKIVAGEVAADTVAETELAVAFRDINPAAPTHVLVIPRVHSKTLPELADAHPDAALAVLTLAREVAVAEGVVDGYRLACNNGSGAQQSVFHAHVHVLGGREFTWPPG